MAMKSTIIESAKSKANDAVEEMRGLTKDSDVSELLFDLQQMKIDFIAVGASELDSQLKSYNVVVDVFSKPSSPRRVLNFFIEDFEMKSKEQAVKDVLNKSEMLKDVPFEVVKHQDGYHYVRFKPTALNKLNGLKKSRYRDLILLPLNGLFKLLIPFYYVQAVDAI